MSTNAIEVRSAECMGKGVGFERIRRVTGYLSNLKNFNDAKRAEEHDRRVHEPIALA